MVCVAGLDSKNDLVMELVQKNDSKQQFPLYEFNFSSSLSLI